MRAIELRRLGSSFCLSSLVASVAAASESRCFCSLVWMAVMRSLQTFWSALTAASLRPRAQSAQALAKTGEPSGQLCIAPR